MACTLTHTNKWTGVQVSNYRGVAMYCIVKYIGNSILLHWIVLHCTVKYITVEKLHFNDGTHTVTGALGCRWVVTEERHSIALWNVLAIPYHYIELSWVALHCIALWSILQWKNYTTTKAHTLAGVQVSNYWWEAPPMSALACIAVNATHCIVFTASYCELSCNALSCNSTRLIAPPPMCALACGALNTRRCIVKLCKEMGFTALHCELSCIGHCIVLHNNKVVCTTYVCPGLHCIECSTMHCLA